MTFRSRIGLFGSEIEHGEPTPMWVHWQEVPPPDPLRPDETDAEAAAQDYLDRSGARRAARRRSGLTAALCLLALFSLGVLLGWIAGGAS